MKEKSKKELQSWIASVSIAIIFTVVCRVFLFSPITVIGESMMPTFKAKDRIIVSKISEIQRFDTIVFDAPDVKDKHYIKRVIGLPGDKIEMKDDILYVNDTAFEEVYVNRNINKTMYNKVTGDFDLQEYTGETEVPDNHFFVLGDNRWNSSDSREFGFIDADTVIGEVKFRFFPFNNMGMTE